MAVEPLNDDDLEFLRDFVDGGMSVRDACRTAWGQASSKNVRRARLLLNRPDAQKFMHNHRRDHHELMIQTPQDLVVALDQFIANPKTPNKYQMKALEALARIMVASGGKTGGWLSPDESGDKQLRGLSAEQVQHIRRQMIGALTNVGRKEIEKETKREAVRYVDTTAIGDSGESELQQGSEVQGSGTDT